MSLRRTGSKLTRFVWNGLTASDCVNTERGGADFAASWKRNLKCHSNCFQCFFLSTAQAPFVSVLVLYEIIFSFQIQWRISWTDLTLAIYHFVLDLSPKTDLSLFVKRQSVQQVYSKCTHWYLMIKFFFLNGTKYLEIDMRTFQQYFLF